MLSLLVDDLADTPCPAPRPSITTFSADPSYSARGSFKPSKFISPTDVSNAYRYAPSSILNSAPSLANRSWNILRTYGSSSRYSMVLPPSLTSRFKPRQSTRVHPRPPRKVTGKANTPRGCFDVPLSLWNQRQGLVKTVLVIAKNRLFSLPPTAPSVAFALQRLLLLIQIPKSTMQHLLHRHREVNLCP